MSYRSAEARGGTIPPTITGTEAEFTVNLLSQDYTPDFTLRQGVAQAGYDYAFGENPLNLYLSNGCLLGTDSSIPFQPVLIKHASGEEPDVTRAAASRQGAPKLIRKVLGAAGIEFAARGGVSVVGRTGYAHGAEDNNLSTGPHTSFLYEPAPENAGIPAQEFVDRLATYWATRHFLYGAGMVGEEYLLSQKGPHIQHVVRPKRTDWYRGKELLEIHSGSMSYSKPNQVRIEDKGGDLAISNWTAFVGAGTSAAFLHAMRYGRRESINRLPVLDEPLRTFADANTFETMHHPLLLRDGRYMSGVDIQEAYLEFIAEVDAEHGLPAEENRALREARGGVNDLRIGELSLLDDRMEWAARLSHLQRVIPGEITNTNAKAVGTDLLWDMRLPEGPGVRYWRDQPSMRILSQTIIDHTVTSPAPNSRARWRADHITQPHPEGRLRTVGWAHVTTGRYNGKDVEILLQLDPSGRDGPRTVRPKK